MKFTPPPHPKNAAGKDRKVGFELEFSGIDLEKTVTTVCSVMDAKCLSRTEAEVALDIAGLGKFNIEIDWAFLKSKASGKDDDERGPGWLELLSQTAAKIVPIEIVCPPIGIDQLSQLTPMVDALRIAGAIGTEESFISAYGVHVNTEIPALDAKTLHSYLRAYGLLQWWLIDKRAINPARRISPYINLYPEAYLGRILSNPEATMDQIFDDYLKYNSTRNRALDLLPILAEIDEKRVRNVIDDPRIKPRPAFHYRLPDCHIEKDHWSLQQPWDSWLVVEKLADQPQAVNRLSKDFLAKNRPLLKVNRRNWIEHIDRWLKNHELV